MALESPGSEHTNLDRLKQQLSNLRDVIVQNFGDSLDFSFVSSKQTWFGKSDLPPNTTLVLLQCANKEQFGVLRFLFYNKSKKILSVYVMDVKEEIPDMASFWFFGVLPLSVLAFNIYMIVRIRRSRYMLKWPRYIAVIALNIPTLVYFPTGAFSFQPFHIELLFGVGLDIGGYLGTSWGMGIPLGGLFYLWQLKRGKDKPRDPDVENTIFDESVGDGSLV